MGMKRPHSEAEPSGNQEGGRPRTAPQKHWSKRQKVDVSEENFGAIKKRARAIERLLARDNLKIPADKQIELERELAAHKQRIAEGKARKHRSYMIGKYHMVRFFGKPNVINDRSVRHRNVDIAFVTKSGKRLQDSQSS